MRKKNKIPTHHQKNYFPIVCIGGSAGGLEAFEDLLKNISNRPQMALVFIMHLAPGYKSLLPELLARLTKMPVSEITSGMIPEINHIYVKPSNASLVLYRGKLMLSALEPGNVKRMPIDTFFRSLANELGNRSIGVILSGTATDGTLGAEAIKAEGGITFAQDAKTAKYNDMPHSAISAGCVDFVFSPKKIAAELMRIAKQPFILSPVLCKIDKTVITKNKSFEIIFDILRRAKGLDFTYYKHPTVLRRVSRRIILTKQGNLKNYVKFLREDKNEAGNLYEDLLINVTGFFRDKKVFQALEKSIIPKIIKSKAKDEGIRVWVPGCSSGEEAYSIAMLFVESLRQRIDGFPLQIFATDASDKSIHKARRGVYGPSIKNDITAARLKKFFVKEGNSYKISKHLREMCIFSKQNVFGDPPFSNIDLVSCRNMLIYFQPALQKKVFHNFHYSLRPGSFLVLGNSESASGYSNLFKSFDRKNKIFVKKYVSIKSMFKLSQNYYPLKKSEGGTKSGINIRKEVDVSGLADQILLKECAPCGVLIDSSMEVVQFRGHTGRFLESGAGRPNLDIFKLAREGLLMPLRSVIYQVKKTKHTVKKEVDNVSCDGRKISVSIVVIPIKPANLKDEFYLVLFNEIDRTAESKNLPRTTGKIPLKIISDKKESYVRDLEKELTETKEYLQTVIEEQENANEEIKTANEEILSSNEELQSTNEELETAKEELQSSNEELMTTNEELQNRNLEVSLLNNDLINLFGSINIPIVMMGTDLMIRRVTPQADKVLNITFSDLGRPIGRVKLNVDIPDFEKTLYGVIESLHPKIFEAQDKQGCWYSVYIRPYRTIDNKIDGVVAVFVDITASRKAAQAIEEARIYADSIIETVQESLLVVDDELKVVSANKAFYQTFKTNPKETNGCFFYGLGNGHWDIPKLRQILKNGFAKKNSVTGYEIEHNFDVIGHKIMLFSACRLASMHLTLITINDITERKVIERELVRVKETQFKTLMENLPGKVFLKDSKSVYISCNESYAKDLGVAPEAVVGKTDYEFFPTYLAEKYRADDKRVIESAKIENLEEEYVVIGDYFKEVKKSIINIVKIPVRDKAGNVMGLFGFFWDITERKKAEEELRNLNKRIEFILGATKTGLDVIDSDFNMVYINPEWQKIYGDPTGRKCYEYFMGKDKVCSNCGIVKALETKNTVVTEEVLVKENNRPVQITTIPFQDKDGNWLVAEVNVDISERKKAEEQLRISDKKIRALFDQTFQFIGMMTTDGKLIEANKTAMQFSGINEADCIGKFFWDTPWWVHSEEMQNKLREAVTKAASGEPVCFEATHLAADKSLRYIDFSLKPVKDLDGKVIFLIPEGRDITEHKKAEEELKKYHDHLEEIVKEKTKAIEESEKRFKVLFEDARDGILLVDIEAKKVIMCNKMMCSMLKYTEEELKQLTINDIHLEKDLSQVMDIFKKMAQGKAMFAENVPMRTKDGSIFYADVTASQINFSGNNYLMGNFRDTTERKKIEAALTDTIKIKSNFTGMVSHELRTPLAAIKEGVAVVLDKVTGVVNEEQVKYLNIVKNNVDRLDRLITAVLDFQKLESGKIDFNIEESCMNELVTGVYNTMLVLFKKKGLSFELKLCDNLPKAQFDKDKIVQVLTNLVNNAFKFTEIGGIIISTSVKGNFIQVEVKDSGIGIKKENIEKLFQEFTQLQRKVGGTGLGLSICKKIILAHKGEIWAESEFGKGTVFYFTIPIEIKRLGEILVEEGKISNEDLEKALEKQKKNYIISSITRKH